MTVERRLAIATLGFRGAVGGGPGGGGVAVNLGDVTIAGSLAVTLRTGLGTLTSPVVRLLPIVSPPIPVTLSDTNFVVTLEV